MKWKVSYMTKPIVTNLPSYMMPYLCFMVSFKYIYLAKNNFTVKGNLYKEFYTKKVKCTIMDSVV